MVFGLGVLATAQHRLDIENSSNISEYVQAWTQATLDEVIGWLQTGSGVNARDEDGWTPLMWAAWRNKNPAVIEALINAGAEVNARTENASTALMRAARRSKNPAVSQALLNAGADATLRGTDGKKAIDYAKENDALNGTDSYWQLHDASF